MSEYQAVYKCRLCGEKFSVELCYPLSGAKVYGDGTAYWGNSYAYSLLSEPQCIRERIHFCKDGSYGFADFIGFKRAKKEQSYV